EFPPSRDGQKAFIEELRNLTDSLGTGLVYWGGELVAYKGTQAQDGSPYENQALFSFNGVALPAISVLGSND
ncbi:MAG TPA: arabinogalactan endo-1,4-beta-galactosidase, partial [Cryomorphaceae bacterium]|nr:arabinogalactan endo-1,4-beta-galactosidase [Cryomorphaceae bacterium]